MTTKTTTVKTVKPEVTHVFHSQKGVVIGRKNSCGISILTTRDFQAESLEELMKKIKNAFNSNTLDINLQLDSVIAAGVEIVDESSVEIDGKVYTNTTVHNEIFGDKDFFNELVDNGTIIDTCPCDLM
jgi:hypothetical protein